jgi:hypothetical protein
VLRLRGQPQPAPHISGVEDKAIVREMIKNVEREPFVEVSRRPQLGDAAEQHVAELHFGAAAPVPVVDPLSVTAS